MPKINFVTDLKPGSKIKDIFYVTGWNISKTKTGKNFLRTKLSDKTGDIDAVLWDYVPEDFSESLDKCYALVSGSVSLYQDKLQVVINYMQNSPGEMNLADFMPVSPKDVESMKADLHKWISDIERNEIRALVENIFYTEEVKKLFSLAPAGKSMHHAYVGGLMEHTLCVVRNCVALVEFYPRIDKDILIAGALLHDIGKIKELVWVGPSIEYSDEGNLVGHLFMGAAMLREHAANIKSIKPLDVQSIEHMILSHHGEHEYGSPVLPKSMEAQLLHYADNIDARLFQMNEAIELSEERSENGNFTGWNKTFERPIFKGLPADSDFSS